MDDDNEIELKLRYRCPNCKSLESHRPSDKKRKCKNCGSSLTEITEKDYHNYKHKLKKSSEEDEITGRQACLHCNLFNVLISMVELNKIEEKNNNIDIYWQSNH